jgi:hypothetical protein
VDGNLTSGAASGDLNWIAGQAAGSGLALFRRHELRSTVAYWHAEAQFGALHFAAIKG